MAIVWTAEANDSLAPRKREDLAPSKQLKAPLAKKKLLEAIDKLPPYDTNSYVGNLVRDTHRLRALFLAAQDDAREGAIAKMEVSWAKSSLGAKTALAYTCGNEAWCETVCKGWLEATSTVPVELLYAIVRDLELAKKVMSKRSTSRSYYELVRTFEDEFLPVLLELFEEPRDEFDLWHCARSMVLYDDVRVGEKLATVFRKGRIKPYATDFFVRFPHHAETVLGPMAKGKTKAAQFAREILEGARRKADAGPPSAEAKPEALPAILVTPPWTIKKRPVRATFAVNRPMPARKETVHVDSDVTSISLADAEVVMRPAGEMTDEIKKQFEAAVEAKNHMDVLVFQSARVPKELQLAAWDAGAKVYSYATDIVDYMLGTFGERALEGLVKYLDGAFAYASEAKGDALIGIDSPRIAHALLKYTAKRDGKAIAWRWMHAHPETAAFALVGELLNGDEAADRVFRELMKDGLDVGKAVAPWGTDVRKATEEWVAFDRRNLVPQKLPKIPPFWKPDVYTRPLLKDGTSLPISAVNAIGVMLALSTSDDPYAGIADVKEACDARSLAEFSWDVARSWEHAGAKSNYSWMRDALIWFADDEVVRRTTPAMKVENVLVALEAIGTPAAQMELVTIAAKGYDGAEHALEHIAETHRVTRAELEDRIVPTAGVDAKGEIELDYGKRILKVGFDSRLEPYVVGEDGSKGRALPPARKTDDPAKVEIAKRIWSDLKEDVGTLAVRRIASLENAMCTGRTWRAEDFRVLFLEHPLTSHLARGIVWCALPDTLFRIAEDGSLADEHDQPVEIGEGLIQIAHPIRNGVEALVKWQQPFNDYELVQPFAQIARRVHARPAVEEKQTELSVEIPPIDRADLVEKLKLRTYANNLTRPMYEARGVVTLRLVETRLTKVSLSFTRRRLSFFIAKVPEMDVSEALHDILD